MPAERKISSASVDADVSSSRMPFGDLELEVGGAHPRFAQQLEDTLGEARIAELDGRDVDGEQAPGPLRAFLAGFAQDELAQRLDQAARFGNRDEMGRRHLAEARVGPARQSFGADDGVVVGTVERLKGGAELPRALERVAQFGLDGVPVLQQLVHRFLEDRGLVAAGDLGFVERDVGLAQQFAGIDFVAVGRRDADRDADESLAAPEVERLADGIDDASSELHRLAIAMLMDDEQSEFVGAKPGDALAALRELAQPLADGFEQIVASGVAERIVDLLEAVEIEHQHAHTALARGALRQQAAQRALETDAVGQVGQRIVQGAVFGFGAPEIKRLGFSACLPSRMA